MKPSEYVAVIVCGLSVLTALLFAADWIFNNRIESRTRALDSVALSFWSGAYFFK